MYLAWDGDIAVFKFEIWARDKIGGRIFCFEILCVQKDEVNLKLEGVFFALSKQGANIIPMRSSKIE